METDFTLEDLHDLPWSVIKGAYVRVRTVTDDVDTIAPLSEREPTQTEEMREGTIAGRHRGWKVKWLPDQSDFAGPVSPIVVIETPDDTYLEVATDTLENELVEIELADGGSDD